MSASFMLAPLEYYLRLKMETPGIGHGPGIAGINDYLDASIEEIDQLIRATLAMRE